MKKVPMIQKNTPLHEVDLDTPPEKRWINIVKKYEKFLPALVKDMRASEQEEGPLLTSTFKTISKIVNLIYVPLELKKEMVGIAEYTKKFGLNYMDILMLNVAYSLISGCTSAVKHGTHFRNMDWDDFESLRDLTIDVQFKRGKKKFFRITSWVCFVGTFTGMNSSWSVSLNYRKIGSMYSTISNFFCGLFSFYPIEFLIRNALETKETVEEALKMFKNTSIVSPCYLTFCGKGVGCVIVRNRKSTERVIKDEAVLQTNHDQWVKKLTKKWMGDDVLLQNTMERKEVGDKVMKEIKNDKNIIENGFKLLETFPVQNEWTIFSVVMCPEKQIYESKTWMRSTDSKISIKEVEKDLEKENTLKEDLNEKKIDEKEKKDDKLKEEESIKIVVEDE